MKILNIVGARPNFMKAAPVINELNKFPDKFIHKLIHTGQHYDKQMSEVFFIDLNLPKPDIDLNVGSGSHAEQTANIMLKFEQVCILEKPDIIIVYGDVNSTLACTITAKKLGIKVAHVEAGLRSNDLSMPEEMNRICTDVLCDMLFTTDRIANDNLKNEGISDKKIHFVGNVMIDTLLKHKNKAQNLNVLESIDFKSKSYGLLTLHRPSNVDDKVILEGILNVICEISNKLPIIFPIHPRTKSKIENFGLSTLIKNSKIRILEPLGYLDFLHLNMNADLVLTDSGGLQEETTVLGVPCLTIRNNTERPITCSKGTNRLVGNNPKVILKNALDILANGLSSSSQPEKWDGCAAQRIVKILSKLEC